MATTYLQIINAETCSNLECTYKGLDMKLPYKYVEKGLLIHTDETIEDFIQCIEEHIKVANISFSTLRRYLRNLREERVQIEILFEILRLFRNRSQSV